LFDVPDSLPDTTLLGALQGGGGPGIIGASRILLRAAVAAVLNAETVGYPLTTDQIVAAVNSALASNNRSTILALASELDSLNNAGECQLS
jgi:hypothetical protein